MGWVNVPVNTPLNIVQSFVSDPDAFMSNGCPCNSSYINFVWSEASLLQTGFLIGDTTNGFKLNKSGSTVYADTMYVNGSYTWWPGTECNAQYYNVTFVALVNEETHKGFIGCASQYTISPTTIDWWAGATPPYPNYQNQFYTIITNNVVVHYNWSSVPAISGKNGILSLPTLVDTDGEPISGQSASVFSSLPEGSNVRALINGAL